MTGISHAITVTLMSVFMTDTSLGLFVRALWEILVHRLNDFSGVS
jgi:hypothetical protein